MLAIYITFMYMYLFFIEIDKTMVIEDKYSTFNLNIKYHLPILAKIITS